MRWLLPLVLMACTSYGEADPPLTPAPSAPVSTTAATEASAPASDSVSKAPAAQPGGGCFTPGAPTPLSSRVLIVRQGTSVPTADFDVSPDGSKVVYATAIGIVVADTATLLPSQMAVRAGAKSPSFLGGSTHVLYVNDGLHVLDVTTGKSVAVDDEEFDLGLAVQAVASRDGGRIAFTADPTDGGRTSTYVMDFDGKSVGSNLKRLSTNTTDRDPSFAGDRILVERAGDIVALGDSEQVLLHDACAHHHFHRPRISGDGASLMFLDDSKGETDVVLAQADGVNAHVIEGMTGAASFAWTE